MSTLSLFTSVYYHRLNNVLGPVFMRMWTHKKVKWYINYLGNTYNNLKELSYIEMMNRVKDRVLRTHFQTT